MSKPEEYQLPSCSGLSRVSMCPASEIIPIRVVEPSGDAADRGSELHTFIANVKDKGMLIREAILKVSPQSQHTAAGLQLDKIALGLTNTRYEVAYALDIATELQRELGVYLERDYPTTLPTEVRGSLDIEGFTKHGIPVVQDIKTGRHQGGVAEQVQMRFFSTVLMLKHGVDTCRGEILYIQDDGKVEIEGHTFTSKDIDETIQWLGYIRGKVMMGMEKYHSTGQLSVHPGDWCHYCPVYNSCPEKNALVPLLAPRLRGLDASKLEELDNEELSAAYLLFAEIDPIHTRVKKRLRTLVRERGVDHKDGSKTRVIFRSNEKVNDRMLLTLLRQSGVSEGEIAACVYRNEYEVLHTYAPPKPKKTKK